jgi:trehalose utilization protein
MSTHFEHPIRHWYGVKTSTNRRARRGRPLPRRHAHDQIAKALHERGQQHRDQTTVVLQDPSMASVEALAETDVLVWWGHAAHGEVKDEIVERVASASGKAWA